MRKHKNSLTEEKNKALYMFFNDEKKMGEIAKELGIAVATAYRWRKEYIQKINPKSNKKK